MRARSSATYYITLFLLIIGTLALVVLPALFYLNTLKGKAIERLERAIQKKVVYDSMSISFDEGIGFRINGLSIRELDGSETLVAADHIFVGLDLRGLLKRVVRINSVYLYRPRLFISRDSSGKCNISDLFSSQSASEPYSDNHSGRPFGTSLSPLVWKDRVVISEGEIFYRDDAIVNKGHLLHIERFNIKMQTRRSGTSLDVDGSFVIQDATDSPATIRLKGEMGGLRTARSLAEVDLDVALRCQGIRLDQSVPYLWKGLCGENLKGHADLDILFKGRYPFPATGQVKAIVYAPQWTCPLVYKDPFHAMQLSLETKVTLTEDTIEMEDVGFTLDEMKIQGAFTLKGLHDHNLHLSRRGGSFPRVS
jgi:hypothetical protein